VAVAKEEGEKLRLKLAGCMQQMDLLKD